MGMTTADSNSSVKFLGNISETMNIENKLRQMDALSSLLFNTALTDL